VLGWDPAGPEVAAGAVEAAVAAAVPGVVVGAGTVVVVVAAVVAAAVQPVQLAVAAGQLELQLVALHLEGKRNSLVVAAAAGLPYLERGPAAAAAVAQVLLLAPVDQSLRGGEQ
jgi:hypothetical protein